MLLRVLRRAYWRERVIYTSRVDYARHLLYIMLPLIARQPLRYVSRYDAMIRHACQRCRHRRDAYSPILASLSMMPHFLRRAIYALRTFTLMPRTVVLLRCCRIDAVDATLLPLCC